MREMKLQDLKTEVADRAARLRRGARGRERLDHAQAGPDVRDPEAAGRAKTSRSSATASLEMLQDGFGFLRSPDANYLAGPRRHLRLARRRSAASACAPATRSKARSAARRKASAISRCSRSTRSISRTRRTTRHKVHFDNLTPLYPDERLKLEIDDPTQQGHDRPGDRHRRADRQGPARADRRPAAHRQDGDAAEHRPVDHRQPPRMLPDRAADRRAARGSHRHAALGEGRGRSPRPSTSRRRATCRSPRW